MKITVNGRSLETSSGTRLIEACRAGGIDIPSLCYLRGFEPHTSCMICVVENKTSGRLIPSCSALAVGGMVIETDSDAVTEARRSAVELLLSEHAGECAAPCVKVCPSSIEIPLIMGLIRSGETGAAREAALSAAGVCPDEECGRRCEKVCRRNLHDSAVAISGVIGFLISGGAGPDAQARRKEPGKKRFNSVLGRLSEEEMRGLVLPETDVPRSGTESFSGNDLLNESLRCLLCGCAKPDTCRLRDHAENFGAVHRRHKGERNLFRRVEAKNYIFEPGKCVKCGICVRISEREGIRYGFAFTGRGFASEVGVAFGRYDNAELADKIGTLIENCPTGAISGKDRSTVKKNE